MSWGHWHPCDRSPGITGSIILGSYGETNSFFGPVAWSFEQWHPNHVYLSKITFHEL